MNPQIAGTQSNLALDDIVREYGKLVSSVCRRMIMGGEIARAAPSKPGSAAYLKR